MPEAERSASRGRALLQSTGRGGLGNFRQSSTSRDARSESGPDDFSPARGREPLTNPQQIFSTGRGGAGNLRSPSRDVNKAPAIDSIEEDVIREYKVSHEDDPHSTGRGGLGNINRSRSRDPASHPTVHPNVHPVVHSTGRGGAGNIVPGEGSFVESDEDPEKHHLTHEGFHSTGRGGTANMTSAPEPAVEHHTHIGGGYQSTGRGGAGNLVKDSSTSES